MKIFLSNQTMNFSSLLDDMKQKPVMPYDKKAMKEKISVIELNSANVNQGLQSFFDYQIFPSQILTYASQWQIENRNMRVGDTILQQVTIPPLQSFSLKLIFGVRINSVVNQPGRWSFSYETLDGHAERGESTFLIEKSGESHFFKIITYSEPSNFLSKLTGPVFAIPYQTFCTQKALRNVKLLFEK